MSRRSAAAWCVEASEATVQAAQLLRPQDVSVYVGIPFCPTRCAYCSFVSSSIERFSGLLEPYLDALVREIAHTGDLLRASGRTVRTLYIGGGHAHDALGGPAAQAHGGAADTY